MAFHRTWMAAAGMFGSITLVTSFATAQKRYGVGATDTEIKIGNIMPYSGPASSYATTGKAMAAYFDKINSEGGINSRKARFWSPDGDAFNDYRRALTIVDERPEEVEIFETTLREAHAVKEAATKRLPEISDHIDRLISLMMGLEP